MRIEVAAAFPARERLEGLERDEPLGAGRQDRDDLVPVAHQQADELAGLVRRDRHR